MNKKTIVIINGKGGVGKDSCILSLSKNSKLNVVNVSSIDPVKELAIQLGWWDGITKDDNARAMLSHLKQAMIYGNNGIMKFINKNISQFIVSPNDVMFIHIREPKEIIKLKNNLEHLSDAVNVVTLLITRSDIENKKYGNPSDDDVNANFVYNYIYENTLNTGLEEFPKWFENVVLHNEREVCKYE